MLCKKIINFFSLLSRTQEMKRLGITQELLSLVTGLAHYLKILIRVALTTALRLVSPSRALRLPMVLITPLSLRNWCWAAPSPCRVCWPS